MQTPRPFRLRQAMLLLAALLHLVGAAAVPALHALLPAAPAATRVATLDPARDDAPSAFVHDETTCVVCQAAHAHVLLPDGAEGIHAAGREAPAQAPLAHPRPAPRDAASLARAPPAIG